MMFTVEMNLEKETKGALRYQEVVGGIRVDKGYRIGTLYLRKDGLPSPPPTIIFVQISDTEAR